MGARAKAKASSGSGNDNRPGRKAWKEGKSPEVRAQEATQKAQQKRDRKRHAEVLAQAHLYAQGAANVKSSANI